MKFCFVKPLAAICLLLIFFSTIRAQKDCAWTNASANVALNLRLGMTTAEANAALGGKPKIKNKTRGDYRFFQNYIGNKPPSKLFNVRALFLRFFDGRLYQMEIFYEKEFSPSLENFTETIAWQYDFPTSVWVFQNIEAVSVCGEKKLVADYVLNPRIELTDEIILKRVLDAKEK